MQVTYGPEFAVAPPASMREKVDALQAAISEHPQWEPPTEHLFHGGMYCRQVRQPADCLVVGKVHKKDHFFMVVAGTVSMTVDDEVHRITGPCILCSKSGAKRAIYAETDAVYMTVHQLESTTVEDAEAELVEDDPQSMFTVGNKLKHPEELT